MVVWSSQCHNIFWLHQQRWVWENHGEQSPGGRGQHKVPVYWQRTNGDVCCHSHRKIQVCCHSNRNIQICCHSHRYVLFVIDKYKYVSWSQKNTGNGQTFLETWKQRSWFENMQLFIDVNIWTQLAWFPPTNLWRSKLENGTNYSWEAEKISNLYHDEYMIADLTMGFWQQKKLKSYTLGLSYFYFPLFWLVMNWSF